MEKKYMTTVNNFDMQMYSHNLKYKITILFYIKLKLDNNVNIYNFTSV